MHTVPLGVGEMDATHREFVERVDALINADDASVAQSLAALAKHLRRHFDEEREWMTSAAFPSAACHLEEHDAVLRSMEEVQALVATGELSVARTLAFELARWFPEHTDAMDRGLAKWMVKARLGGEPIAFEPRTKIAR
jgi:hemerythrin